MDGLHLWENYAYTWQLDSIISYKPITKSRLPNLDSRWRGCMAAILNPPQGSYSLTHPIEKGDSGLIAARPGVELLQG